MSPSSTARGVSSRIQFDKLKCSGELSRSHVSQSSQVSVSVDSHLYC